MPIGPAQIALIALGILMLIGAVWLLFTQRPTHEDRVAWLTKTGGSKRLSEPTRLSGGLLLLLAGYHLIVWAFPLTLTGVQLNRRLWYVWILIAMAGAMASLLMDRSDRKKVFRKDDPP